ncbi:ferredoxin [Nonomuraea monospora]|uniref:ferredoxin n=1 Tax=Nonomuraea monospora TaxID=568818 RepID=UPI0031D35EA1
MRELPRPETYLLGRWEERNWRNVPGPFYGAATDTCWSGRAIAPAHVLYDDEGGQEFIYRQPLTEPEAHQVLLAAWSDPMSGYARDGDEHWTAASVREWWRERRRLLEWIDQATAKWSVSTRADEREAVTGLRDYAAYMAGALPLDLRRYLFGLDQGRVPGDGDMLPEL